MIGYFNQLKLANICSSFAVKSPKQIQSKNPAHIQPQCVGSSLLDVPRQFLMQTLNIFRQDLEEGAVEAF